MGAVLSDAQIEREVKITPFSQNQKRPHTISYGTSSYGYDSRLGYNFAVFTPIGAKEVDPKNFNPECLVHVSLKDGEYLLIPPHSFVLAETLEHFEVPRNVLVICLGKSTYARCGLVVNVTPLEPEWKGKVTIEISNTTPLPVRIYPGEGICQFIFLRADEVCRVSYADRAGKYQDQTGLTLPKAESE